MTRRRFLGGLAALGTWLAATVLAACSPSSSPSATPARTASIPSMPPPASTPPGTLVPNPSPGTATPGPAGLTLRQRIGRMLVVGFRGTSLASGDPVMRAITAGELGGVILFDRDLLTKAAGRNITSPAQLRELTDALHAAYPPEASARFVVAIDQEGGKVARLNPSDGYPATESEAELGAANDLAHTTAVATATATALADAGIDLNLAPVVDLDVNPRSPAIGALGRSFSADPRVVVAHATAVIDAHHAELVKCAIKHYPGLGSSTGNTDFGVVDVTATWTSQELIPFTELIHDAIPDAVMVGHVVNRTMDPDLPISLSRKHLGAFLRGRFGWQGVVVTDDLQAAAITAKFGADEAIALAIEAGNDLLLFANQQVYDPDIVEHAIAAIVGFVESGRISEARIDESVARIEAMLAPIE